jgi:hypothetical protein
MILQRQHRVAALKPCACVCSFYLAFEGHGHAADGHGRHATFASYCWKTVRLRRVYKLAYKGKMSGPAPQRESYRHAPWQPLLTFLLQPGSHHLLPG